MLVRIANLVVDLKSGSILKCGVHLRNLQWIANPAVFFERMTTANEPFKLNGDIHVINKLINLAESSAMESELRALFLNTKQARII